MANRNSCTRYAKVKVNNRSVDSKLHKALLDKIQIRPVANLVYAMYLQKGVADTMDAKYQRNTQGQHTAEAVLEHLGFQNIVTDIGDASIKAVEHSKGVRDSNKQLHNFKDPLKAYEIAKEINELTDAQGNSKHLTATVVRHGTNFQVLVNPLSSATNLQAKHVENSLFLWDALKQTMGMNGVNMDALRVPFSDILHMDKGMINYLESIVATDNKYLTPREIQFVITANSGSPNTQTLVQAFNGDFKATAQAIYDYYHVGAHKGYAGLIGKTLTESKNLFSVLDSTFNAQTLDKVNAELAASPEMEIVSTLKQLNHKYGIDFVEVEIQDKHARTLSEATARAIMILERRINQLEAKKGTKDEVKKLSKLRDTLVRELESKRYYMGLVNYLTETYDVITKLEQDLDNAPTNGTPFENATALAKILTNQNIFVDGYNNLFRDLLEDLSKVEFLNIDENLAQSDIDNIRDSAKKAFDLLQRVKYRGEELNMQCMTDLCTHILGDKVGPEVTANVVAACASSTWGTDILYSFGRLSDPLCAAIGDMVRDAQDVRNEELQKITLEIREHTAKLHKSGSNSEFIYEDDGHIVSDYDWEAYYKALGRAKGKLQAQGIKGFALEEAMEQWEEANTEELIVDHTPGQERSERVPRLDLYAKKGLSFRHRLTDAQLEYYDAMMEIKGRIGSLLPEWAQQQFLPPQLRRDLITAVTHAKKDGIHKFGRAFRDKVEELYKVKSDDTNWGIMGQNEASYRFARGDLSGKQARQIPIFFVHKLSNGDELFKNFSAGLQALAATAENYHHMSEIVDVAEFMRTYINNTAKTLKINGKLGREAGGTKTTQITANVAQAAQNSAMTFILDNMFDKHFYSINIKGNPFYTKIIQNLVKYTSFKGLATNVFGAVANVSVGNMQMFQMALANTLYKIFTNNKTPYFGLTDWALGLGRLLGAPLEAAASLATGKNVPSLILDLATNNKQSMDYLMAEYFDLFNDNYGTMMHTKYHKGLRQLAHDISFILYGAGEKAIRYITLWAMENATKVQHNNKTISLRKAFVKAGDKTTPHLELLPDLYDTNGKSITDAEGNLTEYGKQYMRTFKRHLRKSCQGMFGAMNDEDKGIVHMHAVTQAGMNFRQWMVEHYSERFRGFHWDNNIKEFVRGYWTSSGKYLQKSLTTEEAQDFLEAGKKIKFMGQIVKDLLTFRTHFIDEWTKSTENQKLDLMRLMSAVITYGILYGVTCGVGGGIVPKFWAGNKDDEKRRMKHMDPERKFAYYQLKRLLFDAESSHPVGAFINFENLVKSPIPAIRTFDNAMYFITGLGDLGTPLKSGPDKGMDKYVRNVLKYNMPFWRDYRRIMEFSESDAMFGIFEDTKLK